MTEPVCKRCGKCCHFIVDGKVLKCKYLRKFKGTTFCRIYPNRLGVLCLDGYDYKCIERKDSSWNYEGCPYNILHPERPVREKP